MKPRPVKRDKSRMYPTYRTFMERHRLGLGAVTAGVGLMVGTTVSAVEHPKRLRGDMRQPRPVMKKEKVATPRPKSQRVPAMKLVRAIELVKLAHKEDGSIGNKKIFIDEAILVRENGQAYWKIGYRLEEYETGHMYMKVTMDGKVKLLPAAKDG